jgi:hypothetical protein
MYTFTNTNPKHYVQHHTNTKPSTNAVRHHHLHTGSHLPTHGQNCNQTHEPLGSYSTNPRPLWSWWHTKHQPTHTGSHKTHDPPHRFTQKITTPNSPFKAEWEKEREERSREGERESQGSALLSQNPPPLVAVMSGAGESLEWPWWPLGFQWYRENREGAVRKKKNGERGGRRLEKKRWVGSTRPGLFLVKPYPVFWEIIGPGQPDPCPFKQPNPI